jgi:hypothetical protein
LGQLNSRVFVGEWSKQRRISFLDMTSLLHFGNQADEILFLSVRQTFKALNTPCRQ